MKALKIGNHTGQHGAGLVEGAAAWVFFTFDFCGLWLSSLWNNTNSVFVYSSYSQADWMLAKYFGYLGKVALCVFKILLNVLDAKYFRERFSWLPLVCWFRSFFFKVEVMILLLKCSSGHRYKFLAYSWLLILYISHSAIWHPCCWFCFFPNAICYLLSILPASKIQLPLGVFPLLEIKRS